MLSYDNPQQTIDVFTYPCTNIAAGLANLSWHQLDTLRWCHNGRDIISNHQRHHCLLKRLFIRRSKKTSKLRVTGLCVGNSPGTGEFPAQMASNAENVSIWWRHHDLLKSWLVFSPKSQPDLVRNASEKCVSCQCVLPVQNLNKYWIEYIANK